MNPAPKISSAKSVPSTVVRETRGDFTVPLWQGCEVIRRHFFTYLALSTMGVAQPILDLYGNNPTVFSAAKMSPLEVGLFVAVVLLAPPVLALLLDRFTRQFGNKVNEATRLCVIGGFSVLLGFAIARWLDLPGDVLPVVVAGACGYGIPKLFDTYKPVREWSRWLSFVALAVLVNGIVQLRPVLVPTDGPDSDAVVGNADISVLQLVFDELPLYPLLDANGDINAERFPGFAELANSSTWFRNSVAESNFTHQAVPAVLASAVPQQSGGPFLAQYPKNIFTLFNGKMKVGGVEPVTSLCPHKTCGTVGGDTFSFDVSRLKTFFRDASYVYGQRVFPPKIRARIPSIEGTWGGFGAVADRFKDSFDVGAFSQIEAMDKGIASLINDPTPRVQVVHALMPHAPWRLTPDGRVAPLSPSITTSNPESEDGVRDTYQTFLLQLGALDAQISKSIGALKQANRWDNTLVVVTADHGISFLPGQPQRHTDFSDEGQSADIYRIPTFIKFPRQSQGEISDCAISNLDLLPTIIDITATKTSWKFGGTSVAKECPIGRTREVVSATGEKMEMSEGFEVMAARVQHYSQMVTHVGPLTKVPAVGSSASLIGKKISGEISDSVITSWSVDQKARFKKVSDTKGSRVPSLITGRVQMSQQMPDGAEGIVAIDGIAAGVIGEISNGLPNLSYTAVLDYSLLTDGAHTLELFVRSPDGVITKVGAPQ